MVLLSEREYTGDYAIPRYGDFARVEARSGAWVRDRTGGLFRRVMEAHGKVSGQDRRARLIELDPKYVDVIVKRWQEYTGQRTVLEADGRGFGQIVLERSRPVAI